MGDAFSVPFILSRICWIFTVQVPTIETTPTSVVGVASVSSRKGSVNARWSTVVHPLQLWRFFWHLELPSVSLKQTRHMLNPGLYAPLDWIIHSLVGTSTAFIIGIITERGRPWGACTPAGTRASHSLTLLAAFGLSKAKTIFLVCGNVALLFDSPSILASVSSVVCVRRSTARSRVFRLKPSHKKITKAAR